MNLSELSSNLIKIWDCNTPSKYIDPYVASYSESVCDRVDLLNDKVSFVESCVREYIKPLYKKEDVKENDMKVKNFKIKNYKVCDNNGIKTVVVEFEDGTKEHAVCCKEDVFELARGVEVCVLKHIFGADKYKEIVRESNRQIKAIDKAVNKAKKEAEESKAIIERKKAKDAKRKAKRKEKERAERIEEMAEAFLKAINECGSDYECNCGCSCETDWDELK